MTEASEDRFLGVFRYLISRGHKMADRNVLAGSCERYACRRLTREL
jgi:hypothetical protein